MTVLGSFVRLTFRTFSDAAQTVPADPDNVTLEVRNPDGTVTTATWPPDGAIVKEGTGVFHRDPAVALVGRYDYRWSATGAVTTSENGSFTIDPAFPSSLASSDDIATRLQRTLTPAEQSAAEAALATASEVIRRETRQDFTVALADTVILGVLELGEWLTLPQQPVNAVTAVEIDGQAVTDYTVVAGRRSTRLYRRGGWYGAGLNTIVGATGNLDATLGDPVSFVTVTYDHGFATIPADVVAVAVNLALPQVVNPEGVTSETVGNYAGQVDNGRADAQAWLLTVEDLKRRYSVRRPLRSVLLSRTWDR